MCVQPQSFNNWNEFGIEDPEFSDGLGPFLKEAFPTYYLANPPPPQKKTPLHESQKNLRSPYSGLKINS